MDNQLRDRIEWWILREKKLNRKNYDEFVRFFVYYMCFDAWISSESGEDSDQKKIKWLISDGGILKEKFEKKEIKGSELIGLKGLSPIKDMRPNHGGKSVSIKDIDNIEDVVRFIYQIRCNLFHGNKSPANDRDSQLVDLAGIFLGNWIRWAILSDVNYKNI